MTRRASAARSLTTLSFATLWGSAVAAGSASLGCVDEHPPLKPRPPGCTDGSCSVGAGTTLTSGASTGSGSAGDGGPQGAAASGTVVVTTNETFEVFSPYAGEASVIAPATGGGSVSAPYGGANGTSFDLQGAQSGLAWLLVEDVTSGGAGILSTYSPALLPSPAPLSLPVIDRSTIETVAMTLGTFLDPEKAHVVLRIRRAGEPLPGVAVTSAGSGFVAYDQGPGVYSSDAAFATGSAGVVLVLNAASEGTPSTLSLTLDDGVTSYTLDPIPVPVGGATLADISL